jgi:hypothetical protein
MNSINASTGFTPFQLCLGCSPPIIPPIMPDTLDPPKNAEIDAKQIVSQIALDVEEAKDNLLQAKIFQAHYANRNCAEEPKYAVGDKVMLSTLHHHNEY